MTQKEKDDMLYGLETIERFANGLSESLRQMQEDLFYLKEWLRETKTGKPSVMKIRGFKR